MNVAQSQGPSVQRHAKHEQLDLATLQAVLAMRDGLRAVDALEQENLDNTTVAYRGIHATKLNRARVAYMRARAGLEAIFLGDL